MDPNMSKMPANAGRKISEPDPEEVQNSQFGPPVPPGAVNDAGVTRVNPLQMPNEAPDVGNRVEQTGLDDEGNRVINDLMIPASGAPDNREGGMGFFPRPYGGWPAMRSLNDSYSQTNQGIQEAAAVASKQAAAEAAAREEEQQRLALSAIYEQQQRAKEQAEIQRRAQEIEKMADDLAKSKIDQGRIFRSPAGILGAIAAGFMSFAGDPYAGIRLINQAVDRDIEVQRMDLNQRKIGLDVKRGLLAEYTAMMKDDQAARLLTESKMKEIAAQKIVEVAARYRSPAVMAEAKVKAGMLQHDATVAKMNALRAAFQDWRLMTPKMKKALGLEDDVPEDVAAEFWGPRYRKPGEVEVQGVPKDSWDVEDEGPGGFSTNAERADIEAIKGNNQKVGAYMREPENPGVKYGTKSATGVSVSLPKSMEAPPTKNGKELLNRVASTYRDPTMKSRIASIKNNLWPVYLNSHKTREDAARAWNKDLIGAINGGVKDIAQAESEVAEFNSTVARARQGIAALKRMYPKDYNKVWGVLNTAGYEGAGQKLRGIESALGLDSQGDKMVRRVMSDILAVKSMRGKQMYGAMPQTEWTRLDQQWNLAGGLDEVENLLDRTASDVNAKVANARKHGNPVAQAYFQATSADAHKARDKKQ